MVGRLFALGPLGAPSKEEATLQGTFVLEGPQGQAQELSLLSTPTGSWVASLGTLRGAVDPAQAAALVAWDPDSLLAKDPPGPR